MPDEAQARGQAVEVLRVDLTANDRSVLEGDDAGFLKVYLASGTDRIVGATLVAAHAGEMIGELGVAITHGLGLGKVGATIHAYPTQSDVFRRAADTWRRRKLTSSAKACLPLAPALSLTDQQAPRPNGRDAAPCSSVASLGLPGAAAAVASWKGALRRARHDGDGDGGEQAEPEHRVVPVPRAGAAPEASEATSPASLRRERTVPGACRCPPDTRAARPSSAQLRSEKGKAGRRKTTASRAAMLTAANCGLLSTRRAMVCGRHSAMRKAGGAEVAAMKTSTTPQPRPKIAPAESVRSELDEADVASA
jgi:hypothetical protein